MTTALKTRKTEVGCLDSIEKAIKAAPDDRKRYIEDNWLSTRKTWANYAREHSPLLLQVGIVSF